MCVRGGAAATEGDYTLHVSIAGDRDAYIPDSDLRIAVAFELDKDPGEAISVDEMASLSELHAGSRDPATEDIEVLTGLENAIGLVELHLDRNAIMDLAPLAGLTALKVLGLSSNRVADVSPLAGLTSLEWLDISDNGIRDASGLSWLTALETLHLRLNQITDVAPLSSLTSLRWLILSSNAITDVSRLAGLTSLGTLDLAKNGIADPTPLSSLGLLRHLDLSSNRIADLTPVRGFTRLWDLRLSDNDITDPSPLAGMVVLRHLDLSGNRISDISPLSTMTSLEVLHLSCNRVTDVSPLTGLTSLRRLGLAENAIADVSPLAGLTALEWLQLSSNRIEDLSPLSRMTSLFDAYLSDNRISDLSPLWSMAAFGDLFLSDNEVEDVSPLAALCLGRLDLSGNAVADLSPLSGTRLLGLFLSDTGISDVAWLARMAVDYLDLSGNAISDVSPLAEMSVSELDLSDNRIAELSPLAGLSTLSGLFLANNQIVELTAFEELRLLRLDASANKITDISPIARLGELKSACVDANAVPEVMPLTYESESRPRVALWRNPLDGHSLHVHIPTLQQRGVGVTGGGWRVPWFPSAGGFRQGFVRIVSSVAGPSIAQAYGLSSQCAWIYATGQDTRPSRLDLGPKRAKHFNSDDLATGNRRKGLRSKIGSEAGGSLDVYASFDMDVLTYIRTPDGFMASMHDTARWLPTDDARLDVLRGGALAESGAAGGYFIPIFNPASDTNHKSLLRLVNASVANAAVAIHAVDDQGVAAGPVRLTLAPRRARTLTAATLESGSAPGLCGSLGHGDGKRRLVVSANVPIHAVNLMSSPTGHLANLSSSSDRLTVPLFTTASHSTQRGFVRVANLSATNGSALVRGYDDTGRSFGPLALRLPAGRTVHFDSEDWEHGADNGLEGAAGAGEGAWRLEFDSSLDLVVSAYVRTSDGFLTSMHDLVDRNTCATPEAGTAGGSQTDHCSCFVLPRPSRLWACRGAMRVPLFNPARNTRQVSSLRLVNRGGADAVATVYGVDDNGAERGPVFVPLRAGIARKLSSHDLESGEGHDLAGALGRGAGKWELRIVVAGEAADDVMVMNLLESPTGHLTNLSTWPDDSLRLR